MRFTIKWTPNEYRTTGEYKVSVPNLSYAEVITIDEHEKIVAKLEDKIARLEGATRRLGAQQRVGW